MEALQLTLKLCQGRFRSCCGTAPAYLLEGQSCLKGRVSGKIAYRSLEGMRCFVQRVCIPNSDRVSDKTQRFWTFIKKDSHQFLKQFSIPSHAIKQLFVIKDIRGAPGLCLRVRRLTCSPGNFFQDVKKLVGIDRLGDIPIHARFDASFPVAFHSMSRHRNNGNMPAGDLFALSDSSRGLKTVHLRHLDVHEYELKLLVLTRVKNFLAILSYGYGVSHFSE